MLSSNSTSTNGGPIVAPQAARELTAFSLPSDQEWWDKWARDVLTSRLFLQRVQAMTGLSKGEVWQLMIFSYLRIWAINAQDSNAQIEEILPLQREILMRIRDDMEDEEDDEPWKH